MLTEMARMSVDDGMVMQIHPGVFRNHNPSLFARFGRDKGADIPLPTEYVRALKPLLDAFGNDPRLTLILFTLDEDTYSRELAPLAGHYPALKLGPPWWFHDSPEGMRRFRERATETAGFYNTVGFNDDTRAFLSIPARHDVARRMDCGFLAQLVAEHRLEEDEAHEVARALAYDLAKAGLQAVTPLSRTGRLLGPPCRLTCRNAPRLMTVRRDAPPGVVHLGIGAFHRAHQAAIFDAALARGRSALGHHRRVAALGAACATS